MSSIGPYAASGAGRPTLANALAKTRSELDDLLGQLSSGKKADSYAGLDDRRIALTMRAKLASVASYASVATTVNTRINLMSKALERVDDIGAEYKLLDPNEYQLTTGSVTIAQSQAAVDLQDAIAQLNIDVGGRYLFSGRSTDVKPVISADAMLADDGDKSGLRTVIAERKLADLGADGRGRIDVSTVAGGAFTVSQQAAGPFGFKISSLNSTLTNGVASGPTGTPPSITLGVAGQPNAGEQARVGLTLPDGTTHEITLTAKAATDTSGVQAGEFRIGATADETAANLRAAFDAALTTSADTALVAASAMQTGEEFFNAAASGQPARVAGFDATYASDADRKAALQGATALDATDTAAKTVSWYVGETGSDDARKTSAAAVADGVSVAYGARADEDGVRQVIQTMAVFSAMTFSPSDTNGRARYSALANRVVGTMGSTKTTTDIKTMATDLSVASKAIKAVGERHAAVKALAEDAVSGAEDADKDVVSLRILALQTQLQASYQVTATLQDLTLVNFL